MSTYVGTSRAIATLAILLGVLGFTGCTVPVTDAPTSQSHRDKRPRDQARDQARKHKPARHEAAPDRRKQRQPRPTYLVVHVVDGDTVDLGNGETVRLVGIDAPEVNECGHERATEKLASLVEGRRITLGESDEDRDRYGRLLRYVDRGPVDAGLVLIRSGLAIARYDSRDGYGAHPRERAYIDADRSSPSVTCAPPPQQFVDTSSGCAPGYSPCIPAYPPDLDCADTGPVTVTGSDPHGLDGDGDGVACGGD